MALRYSNKILSISGKNVKQVNIKVAEKAFNEGKLLWLHPCNMRINSPWQSPMPINKDKAFVGCKSFTSVVEVYKNYNCDNERGKYPIFFVEVA
jgi:hypothetical protein